MSGRGAWPNSGNGGTLNFQRTAPGPYYALATGSLPQVGSVEESTDINVRAVRGGVIAIQRALNRRFKDEIKVTGQFDKATAERVMKFQAEQMTGQKPWPGLGPETSQALFMPDIMARCKKKDWKDPSVICGVIKNESNFDPGAVGFVDVTDLGLAQINGPSHPDYSETQRLAPLPSIDFVIGYMKNATTALGGDEDLAIASYNLGIGGARTWDKAGRPNPYTPNPGGVPRDVEGYISRIKTACRSL